MPPLTPRHPSWSQNSSNPNGNRTEDFLTLSSQVVSEVTSHLSPRTAALAMSVLNSLLGDFHAQVSGCLEWQIYIHGSGYPKGMFLTVKTTETEILSSSRPWVKKGRDGWFLHRQPQDGEGLSGATPSSPVQRGAERHTLRCQGVVVGGGGD